MAKVGLGCEPVVGSLTSRYYNIFATVGGTRTTVYWCLDGGPIVVLQAYNDEDKDESYYTLSWAYYIDGAPFFVVSGSNEIIRVINTGTETLYKNLVNHGMEFIFDMRDSVRLLWCWQRHYSFESSPLPAPSCSRMRTLPRKHPMVTRSPLRPVKSSQSLFAGAASLAPSPTRAGKRNAYLRLEDIFFSQLTVQETIILATELQLPDILSATMKVLGC